MPQTLASGIAYADLKFEERANIIAACFLQDASGVAIVDPGPSSCLPALEDALRQRGGSIDDVHTVLLTHIHLDHAGAAGSLVRRNARIHVFVHEVGAPHMIDPSRFLNSARRLYGDAMGALFGEFVPVPAANVTSLSGGETIPLASRRLEVAYTPGHASHHVTYFDPESRIAFVGDTAGIRQGQSGFVLPPLAPPDINLELWEASIARILEWEPKTIFLTHFGPYDDVRPHFAELQENFAVTSRIVKDTLAATATDGERAATFAQKVMQLMRSRMPAADADAYALAGPLEHNWIGLARYWRKKEGAARSA
jgi:glyoxylase-like metal-dependent hydrolase (beta-lactamase superfamily II)